MKKIPVKGGFFALVDDEDFEHLSKYKWRLDVGGYPLRTGHDGERVFAVFMHRSVFTPDEGCETDHINRNKLDARKANLRSATRAQNMCNRPAYKSNKLGEKGVVCRKGRFRAVIHVDKKQISVGTFSTLEEAVKARNTLALKLHHEFAFS